MQPAPFFVLRTPLLPFSVLTALAGDEEGDRSPVAVRRRLAALVERLDVGEALWLASPSLYESLPIWRQQPTSERGAKIERALIRYVARMAGRAMPFGLFAGCSVGVPAARSSLRLDEPSRYRRHSRLDSEYLWEDGLTLSRQPALRGQVRLFTNTSCYRVGDSIRHAQLTTGARGRIYRLAGVERSDYLELVLERARDGALRGELEQLLAEAVDVPPAEVTAFVDELIDSQLLVSALLPTVVGDEPAQLMRDELHRAGAADEAERLGRAQERLRVLDDGGLGAPVDAYRQLAAELSALPVAPTLTRLCQVDLFKPAPGLTLGPSPLAELQRSIGILHALAARPPSAALADFRQALSERYGEAEVPLMEALDEETGVGFGRVGAVGTDPSPLLGALQLRAPAEASSGPWTPLHDILARKLGPALAARQLQLTLDEADLARLPAPRLPLAASFAALCSVEATDEAALDRGDFRLHLQAVGGPPGVRLLGRFSHLAPELTAHVRAETAAEQQALGEVLAAEVVFSPPGRVANICNRPTLREHELPFLLRSTRPAEQRIAVDDLVVSATRERVLLRSASRGCEIAPRHSAALNMPTGNLAVYRFLRAMQDQGVQARLEWDWGPLVACMFLPRVAFGRVLLALARWRLSRADLAPLDDEATRMAGLAELRARHQLPRFVSLIEIDRTLPVDLENPLALAALLHESRQGQDLIVTECFPGPDALCARDERQRFVHELIVPFRAPAPPVPAPPATPRRVPVEERHVAPGGRWAYFKLYCGEAAADRILIEQVAPFCARHADELASWFFIRYRDPQHHLRLRFAGRDAAATAAVRAAWEAEASSLLQRGQLWRVQLDTYDREVERYGGADALALSEALFHADSDATLAILQLLDADDLQARWQATLLGVRALLADSGLEPAAQLALAQQRRDRYRQELEVDDSVLRTIGERFRDERRLFDELTRPGSLARQRWQPILDVLEQRSERTRPLFAALAALGPQRELPRTLARQTSNFMHMHAIRVLRSSPRPQELVLYDFLYRLCDAERARGRGRSS